MMETWLFEELYSSMDPYADLEWSNLDLFNQMPLFFIPKPALKWPANLTYLHASTTVRPKQTKSELEKKQGRSNCCYCCCKCCYHESAVGKTLTHPPLLLFSSRAFFTIRDNSWDRELGVAASRMAAKRLQRIGDFKSFCHRKNTPEILSSWEKLIDTWFQQTLAAWFPFSPWSCHPRVKFNNHFNEKRFNKVRPFNNLQKNTQL